MVNNNLSINLSQEKKSHDVSSLYKIVLNLMKSLKKKKLQTGIGLSMIAS
jgi:hypothetical protein